MVDRSGCEKLDCQIMSKVSIPTFTQPFQGARLQQGNTAQFQAVTSGTPQPEVLWTRHGQQLQSSDKYEASLVSLHVMWFKDTKYPKWLVEKTLYTELYRVDQLQ